MKTTQLNPEIIEELNNDKEINELIDEINLIQENIKLLRLFNAIMTAE